MIKPYRLFLVPEEHNRLTLELVYKNYINEDNSQIFYYDHLFEKLLQDNSYHDLMIMIHYIVPRAISNDFKDEEGNTIENKFAILKMLLIKVYIDLIMMKQELEIITS